MKIKIRNKKLTLKQLVALMLYYSIFRYLPNSMTPLLGPLSKQIRYNCCKHLFKYCGKNVNVERMAYFASGLNLSIGDNSGLGINCHVPANIQIGNNVMMGPNCYVFQNNHKYSDINTPMIKQGHTQSLTTIIKDDVWIGRNVTIMSGRIIEKGTIIAACCVLCKDFPEYSIVGGNPSRLIKSRI